MDLLPDRLFEHLHMDNHPHLENVIAICDEELLLVTWFKDNQMQTNQVQMKHNTSYQTQAIT